MEDAYHLKPVKTVQDHRDYIISLIRLMGETYKHIPGVSNIFTESSGSYKIGEIPISLEGISFEEYEKERYKICAKEDPVVREKETFLLELTKLGGYLNGYLKILKNAA
jgi:hypothetical protein